MPREYDFSQPRNDSFDPYEKLPVYSLPVIKQEVTDSSISDTFFKSGVLARGHFRLDIPEHKAYPLLNDYLNIAYKWLSENCRDSFSWEETQNGESATFADGREAMVQRFSIIITFKRETDCMRFAEACKDHNMFQEVHGEFDGQSTPFIRPESFSEKFIRHAANLFRFSAPTHVPKLALPAPAMRRNDHP